MTRKRSSPMGLEIYLSAMLAIVMLPLLVQAAPVQDYTEIQQYTEGCYYNYNHYNEGDRIMTNEPCLNCTCHNKMLMCYLRVCPFTKPIGHDCIVEKREDQCCPIITCPEVPVDISHAAPEPGTELSIPEKFGCSIDGKFYLEGAQVPSNPNKPCELCYCIKNRTSCLMQECTLHIDGCTPIYNKGSCCPVRYNCDHENDVLGLEDLSTTTEITTTTSTTTTERPTAGFVITSTMSPAVSTDCIHNGDLYADGARIAGETACENCYCMRGDIICAVQECKMPMLAGNGKQCHAMPPADGECCPSNYVCEDDTATTEIYEATTSPYGGLDEDAKITTSAPVKDLHGAIPDEDLQLQTHIDDEDEGVTDSSPLDDVKATEAPSAEEEDESKEGGEDESAETATKDAQEIETSTSKPSESDESFTGAPVVGTSTEGVTDASAETEKESQPIASDEYVTEIPPKHEDMAEGEESKTSTEAPVALDGLQETSSETSIDEHVTKVPSDDKEEAEIYTESVMDTGADEHVPSDGERTETDDDLTTKAPAGVEVSTEIGDELVTTAPVAAATGDEHTPISTETGAELTTKVPGGEEHADVSTETVGASGIDELTTIASVADEQAEVSSESTEDSMSDSGLEHSTESQEQPDVSTESAEEEDKETKPSVTDEMTTTSPIVADKEESAEPAAEDRLTELEDTVTKVPLASITEISTEEDAVTKAPAAGASDNEKPEELSTKTPGLLDEEETTEAAKDIDSGEEISTKSPSVEHVQPSQGKPEATEEQDLATESSTSDEEESTFTTASSVKTDIPATDVPASDEDEEDLSTEGPKEDIKPIAEVENTTTEAAEEVKPSGTEEPSTEHQKPEKSTETSITFSTTEKEMATKAPKYGEEEPSMFEMDHTTKIPAADEDVSTEGSADDEHTEESKPISGDEKQLAATTVAPTHIAPEQNEEDVSTQSSVADAELGSGDFATESSEEEEASKPSIISSSTEGVIDQNEEQKDISTGKPVAVHGAAETTEDSLQSVTTHKTEDKEQFDVTTSIPSLFDVTTSSAEESEETSEEQKDTDEETTTAKTPTVSSTADSKIDDTIDEKTEAGVTPSSEAQDKIDLTTEASEEDKDKLAEVGESSTHAPVFGVSPTTPGFDKDSSEETTSDEDTTKPESSEDSTETEITTVSPAIETVTQAEGDEQKITPESDDHKAEGVPEEHTKPTDSPMVIVDEIPVVTTPAGAADDSSHTEADEEIIGSTVAPGTVSEPATEKLPSLDVKGDFDDKSATTVKPATQDSSVEEMPDIQLPAVIPGEGDCLVGQKTYENNTIIPTTDECEISCRCVSSIVACERVVCHVPENVEKCILDEASTNKCCPTYICGIDSLPPKADESSESTEEDEDEEIEFTTLAAPHKTTQPTGQEADTTAQPAVVPEEPVTIGNVPEIEMPVAGTEEPMSHIKDSDEEGFEQSTKAPVDTMAEDKKDVVVDSQAPTTQAPVDEDVTKPESMAPMEATDKEHMDKKPSSTELPADLKPEENMVTIVPSVSSSDTDKEMPASTIAPSRDEYQTVKPIEDDKSEEDEIDDEAIMAHTTQPDVSQGEMSATPASEDTESSEDIEAHSSVPASATPETHTIPPKSEEDNKDETSSEPEAHTTIPAVTSEEDNETSAESESSTLTPITESPDKDGSGDADSQTSPPVSGDEIHTIAPSTLSPSVDKESNVDTETEFSTKQPEEGSEEPTKETEGQTSKPAAEEESTEKPIKPTAGQSEVTEIVSSTARPIDMDEDKETTEESTKEGIERTTMAPSILESVNESSTVSSDDKLVEPVEDTEAHTVPSAIDTEDNKPFEEAMVPSVEETPSASTVAPISEDEIMEDQTTVSAAQGPDEEMVSSTITSSTEDNKDSDVSTVAPFAEQENKESIKPADEEKPTGQDIEITTTVPSDIETADQSSPQTTVPVGDEILGSTAVPHVEDSPEETSDEADVSTPAPVIPFKEENVTSQIIESDEGPEIQTSTPSSASDEEHKVTSSSEDSIEDMSAQTTTPQAEEDKDIHTTAVPTAEEETAQQTTASPVGAADKEPLDISTDKPIDFEVKIDTTSEDSVTPTVDEAQTDKPTDERVEDEEKESAEEGIIDHTVTSSTDKSTEKEMVSQSVEEEGEEEPSTVTPIADEQAEVIKPVDDDIRKDTTVPSVQEGESDETTAASIEKATELPKEHEVTQAPVEQDKDVSEPSSAVPSIEEEKQELEPSMSHTVAPSVSEGDEESVTSVPVVFEITSDETVTSSPASSDDEAQGSTDKIELASSTMAPVEENEVVAVSVADQEKPAIHVEDITTAVPADDGQTTAAPVQQQPHFDLSEEASGESVESEEETTPTQPQHIGAFVTERGEDITAKPPAKPIHDEEEGSSGEEEDSESDVTVKPELPEQGEDATTVAVPVDNAQTSEDIDASTVKQPTRQDVSSITKAPSTDETPTDAVFAVTEAPMDVEDVEVSTSVSSAEEMSAVTDIPTDVAVIESSTSVPTEQIIAAVTKAPEDIDSTSDKLSEEEDASDSTKAPVIADATSVQSETTESSTVADVSTGIQQDDEISLGVTKVPEGVEGTDNDTAEQPEEDIGSTVTKAPESTEEDTKAPASAEDTTTQESDEDISSSTRTPESANGIETSTSQGFDEEVSAVTKAPETAAGVETSTAQESEEDLSAVTKAPESTDSAEAVTAKQPEGDVSAVTKTPESVEDNGSSTTQEAGVPTVTKAPEPAENIETSTSEESEEEQLAITKAPESTDDAESVTALPSEDNVTKAPASVEAIETSTAQESEEEVPTITKAPVSTEGVDMSTTQVSDHELPTVTKAPEFAEGDETVTSHQQEEEISGVTKAPESADRIETSTSQESMEEEVPAVTKTPESVHASEPSTTQALDDEVSIVTKAPEPVPSQHPEEDVSATTTMAPAAAEDGESGTSQQPEESVSDITKAPEAAGAADIITAEQPDEDVSTTTKVPVSADGDESVTSQQPEEDVSATTKAPVSTEVDESVTAQQPEEDVDATTKAPVATEGDDFVTAQHPKEEVSAITMAPAVAEGIESSTAEQPEEDVSDITNAPEIAAGAESDTAKQPEDDISAITTAPDSEASIEAATTQASEKDISTVTKAPESADNAETSTAQQSDISKDEATATAPVNSEKSEEESDVTTAKTPIQQADEIEEDDATKVPSTDHEHDKTEEEATPAPSIDADKSTSDRMPEQPQESGEATEMPAVAHDVPTVGQAAEQSTESASQEEDSSEESSTESGESSEDNLQPTTTVHPLFPHHSITTAPSVVIDSRIDDTNATDSQTGQGSAEDDEEEFTTPSSTSTSPVPITTSGPGAPHYQPQPPIYGQAPQYPPQYEDEYTDEDETEIFGPGTCRYGGKLYVSAQQIPRDDPCDFCFCFRSDIICLQQSCPPPIAGCHEEPISGFCCPRYECPVSMATVLNITTSTTTTSTTLPPHFLHHSYGNNVQRNGCLINGRSYSVGEKIESTSGPCINCTCGGDGKMKCDPQACVPEPTMQQVMAVVAAGRKR